MKVGKNTPLPSLDHKECDEKETPSPLPFLLPFLLLEGGGSKGAHVKKDSWGGVGNKRLILPFCGCGERVFERGGGW